MSLKRLGALALFGKSRQELLRLSIRGGGLGALSSSGASWKSSVFGRKLGNYQLLGIIYKAVVVLTVTLRG